MLSWVISIFQMLSNELVKGSTAAYGYKVTDEAKKWIKGLAQLERTNYVVKLANTDKYLREESV